MEEGDAFRAAEETNVMYWLYTVEVVEAGEQRGDCVYSSFIEVEEETLSKPHKV